MVIAASTCGAAVGFQGMGRQKNDDPTEADRAVAGGNIFPPASGYPSTSCTPAEPASVSPNKKAYPTLCKNQIKS